MNDEKREGVSLNYYRPLTPHLDLQQQTVGCAEGFTKKEAL